MTAGHKHTAEAPQPLQIETEYGRMVDGGLFQIVEIGGIVHVAEGIDLMKSDPEKCLEHRGIAIRE